MTPRQKELSFSLIDNLSEAIEAGVKREVRYMIEKAIKLNGRDKAVMDRLSLVKRGLAHVGTVLEESNAEIPESAKPVVLTMEHFNNRKKKEIKKSVERVNDTEVSPFKTLLEKSDSQWKFKFVNIGILSKFLEPIALSLGKQVPVEMTFDQLIIEGKKMINEKLLKDLMDEEE